VPLRHIALAIAVAIVWGVNFVPMRWAVDDIPPLLATALRYALAAVPAVFFVPRPRVRLPLLVAYGVSIGVCQFGLLFVALKMGMPAGLASIVMQLQAFFTVLLAVLLMGERRTASTFAGGLIAVLGIVAIGAERLGGAALMPFAITVGAALFWGIGNVLSKRAGRIDMLGFVVWSSLVPPIPLLILSLLTEGPGAIPAALAGISWRSAGSLLFMSYAATIFGYGVWGMLLNRHPAGTVSAFSLLIPVAGLVSAALLLGETVSPLEVGGSVLVLAGLAVNVLGPRIASGWRARRGGPAEQAR
jgi:O-acetylserine/cysteine efflux transporter